MSTAGVLTNFTAADFAAAAIKGGGGGSTTTAAVTETEAPGDVAAAAGGVEEPAAAPPVESRRSPPRPWRSGDRRGSPTQIWCSLRTSEPDTPAQRGATHDFVGASLG